MRAIPLLALTVVVVIMVGLPTTDTTCSIETSLGFWSGMGHGFLIGISFVASLFKEGAGIYETCNNGGWYNTGFVIGLIAAFAEPFGAYTDETDGAKGD